MRYEIGDWRYETGDRNTSLNKSLTQFAHWANKEQIAKRKEHPSVHGTDGCYLLFEKKIPPIGGDFYFTKTYFFLPHFSGQPHVVGLFAAGASTWRSVRWAAPKLSRRYKSRHFVLR